MFKVGDRVVLLLSIKEFYERSSHKDRVYKYIGKVGEIKGINPDNGDCHYGIKFEEEYIVGNKLGVFWFRKIDIVSVREEKLRRILDV